MSDKVKKVACVKLKIKDNPEFVKYIDSIFDLMQKISSAVHSEISNISKIGSFKLIWKNKEYKDSEEFRQLPFIKPVLDDFFKEHANIGFSALRAIYWSVVRMYRSYVGRNKKNMPLPIRVNTNAVAFKDATFKIKEDGSQIIMSTMFDKKIKIKLEVDDKKSFIKNLKYIDFNDKGFKENTGGIINMRTNHLVLTTDDAYFECQDVDSFIGVDINMNFKNFLTWSDGDIISRPKEIQDLLDKLKTYNKLLGKENRALITGNSRTKLNKAKDRMHKRYLPKAMKKWLYPILDKKLKKGIALALDTVTTGATNGSFGQEHVIACCKRYCEENGIFIYEIPTPYTSQMCNKCNVINKENRDGDKFKCVECGHEDHSDVNAAKNVKAYADYLYSIDFESHIGGNRQYNISKIAKIKDHFQWKRNPLNI